MVRALLATLALAAATAGSAAAPAVIEDDYARALGVARELGLPILVDVWAPW